MAGLEKGGEKLVRLLPTSVAATQYLLPQCADAQAWFLRRNRQIMLYHGIPGLEKTSFFCKSGSFWQQGGENLSFVGQNQTQFVCACCCLPLHSFNWPTLMGGKGDGETFSGSMGGGFGLQNIYNIFESTGITGNQVQVQARMGFPL